MRVLNLKPRRWCVTLMTVFVLNSACASAQEKPPAPVRVPQGASTTVPLDSWIYPALDRLAALGYARSGFVGLRPWTRTECQRLLAEAMQEISWDSDAPEEAGRLFNALSEEFSEGPDATRFYKLDSFYFRWLDIAGQPLRDGYHLAETFANDYGRPYAEGSNVVVGMAVSGTSGILAWGARGEWQRWPSSTPLSLPMRQAMATTDNRPVLPDSASGGLRFRLLDTNIALQLGRVQVSFGKQSLWSGPGQAGPWIFSNNAEPIWMAQINGISPMRIPAVSRVLGPARWQFFLGRLTGHKFVFSEPTMYGPPLRSQPFIHGEKVSFHPTENLELGMGVTTIFGGPGMPFTAGNFARTLTFWDAPTNTLNDHGDRRSGFDFCYRLPGLRRWLTVYADTLVEDEVSPIGSSRPAVRAGVYLPRIPHLSKMDLRLEGIYSDVPGQRAPATIYYNHRYRSGYTNDSKLLGSWIGRQGRGGQAWLGYWVQPRSRILISYRHMEADRSMLEGGRLNDIALQSNFRLHRFLRVSGLVQYERWNFPLLSPHPQTNVSVGFGIEVLPSAGR
jgi:hypothetical protein